MFGRTAAEAAQNFRDNFQLTLSCITNAVANIGGGYYPATEPHALLVGAEQPVPLTGKARLALSVQLYYRLEEDPVMHRPWRVTTAGYFYRLEDHDGREVVAYHWHPDERSAVTYPHLHLGAGAQVGRAELLKVHFPTGPIVVGDVVRLAINEFDVRPRRQDWAQILERTRAAGRG